MIHLVILSLNGVLPFDRAGVGHGGRLAGLVVAGTGATSVLRFALKLCQELALPGSTFLVGLKTDDISFKQKNSSGLGHDHLYGFCFFIYSKDLERPVRFSHFL